MSKQKSAKGRKELTPQQQKVMTAVNWVVTILCIALVIFALVEAIFVIARTTNDDKISKFGSKYYMNVASNSMEPTFSRNDMIICDVYNGDGTDLKVGQVISFRDQARLTTSQGPGLYNVINTHRITRIENVNGSLRIYTQGDNREVAPAEDANAKSPSDIVATWGSVDANGNPVDGKMLKGVGAFSNWIQDTEHAGESMKVRFFCVIVLPLILLFVIYAFVLIRTLIIAKLEKERVARTQSVVDIDSLSDEEKRRLAEAYMASILAEKAQSGESDPAAEDTQEQSEAVETDETPLETNSDSDSDN